MKYALILAVILLVSSCSDDYYDINDNPNQAVTTTPELILPSALNQSASLTGLTMNTLGNLFGYYWAPASDFLYYTDELLYNVTETFYTGIFESTYTGALPDYNYISNVESENPVQYNNYKAIARIMKAYHFQYMVDLYGDVPYSDALQSTGLLQPTYDDSQIIYDSIYINLNVATDEIKASLDNPDVQVPGSEDIFLNGNMEQWIKFANTLKLRVLMRQSNLDTDDYITSELRSIAGDGYGFLQAGESVLSNPGYSNSNGKLNPFYSRFINSSGSELGYYRATKGSDYLIDFLNETNDPRVQQMFAPAANSGEYVGIAQGESTTPTNKQLDLSSLGTGILKGPSQDVMILSSFESLFLQAEAIQRGYLTGDAQDLYETAITESFKYLEVPDADSAAEDYYGQNIDQVSWTASSNKLETIIKQKWLALGSINGIELWLDYTRTGYPSDLPLSIDAVQNQRPVRLLYPQSESSTNSGNKPEQSTDSAFDDKIFWDVN